MVQRKTCQAIETYNLQPETRFGQELLKNLGPEMMMMKRTKPRKKLKENTVSSQSGKPQATLKHDLVAKVTGGSPNYMKGTSSSEARKEKKKIFNLSRNQKNQTGLKHDSRYGVNKDRSINKRIVRGLTKAPSFKRCSQRATCSSTLKDSKFPKYLMLNHGETYDEVSGTSVLKVCPYTYCSLNGHLHSVEYPPLKSFISSRRQSLKSQKSVKMEASKEDFVVMKLEEKKECEYGNGEACEIDLDTQISETVSEGAPRSETDSDDYSDSAEMVRFSESDHDIELKETELEETFIDDSMKEIQDKANIDDEYDDQSGCFDSEVKINCFDSEVIGMMENSDADNVTEDEGDDVGEETLKEDEAEDFKEESRERIEVISMLEETAKFPFNFTQKESDMEETLLDDSVEEIHEKSNNNGEADQCSCLESEAINMSKNSAADKATEDEDDAGEETIKDKAEEESKDRIEVISMIEETAKIPYKRTRKPCNQEEPDSIISWTINKCKKPIAETEDLRDFNPRDPNYLPLVVEEDTEKIDLKHQDIDERRNSEDWMFDYALQRVVNKLAPARKKKVALLVEAFETVQPIMPHGRDPAPVLRYGRHLQACN